MSTNERLDVIKKYRTICSEIIEKKLYLGGYHIACNREILEKNGITHIINLSGDTCKNMFEGSLEYRTHYILDSPQESIEGVLYDCIEWIDSKLTQGEENRVFVHCQEGVSRSSSIVIGYLMWKQGRSFTDASEYVRERRETSSPNIGFTYQLILFQKALGLLRPGNHNIEALVGPGGSFVVHVGKKHRVVSTRLYSLSKFGIATPLINWKGDEGTDFNLDSAKIYLLRQSLLEVLTLSRREKLWIWIGSLVKEEGIRESILGILRFCRQILKIELNISSSVELENLDIRADLIFGALKDDENVMSEPVTNILSSTIVLGYFREFSECEEFMRILAPSLHGRGKQDLLQRSFSSPSIKGVSKSQISLDSEEDQHQQQLQQREQERGAPGQEQERRASRVRKVCWDIGGEERAEEGPTEQGREGGAREPSFWTSLLAPPGLSGQGQTRLPPSPSEALGSPEDSASSFSSFPSSEDCSLEDYPFDDFAFSTPASQPQGGSPA
ncbi:dual specificity phosphatase, partial [Cryptosporidium felis]